MFENRVLRKTFGSNRTEGNRGLETSARWEAWWFVLQTRWTNKELHNRPDLCVTLWGRRETHTGLWWGNLHEVDRPGGRSRGRRANIMTMDLKKQDEGRRADRSGDGGDTWRAAVTTVIKIWFHKIMNIRISWGTVSFSQMSLLRAAIWPTSCQ
jgi:hypothetical protein